jgi:diadenosine tetraphosphate (Ap4A) HIT family hydrolase
MKAMYKCPFCALNTQAERTIQVGELTTVVLSTPRLVPGHTLVIPNRHVEKPWELTGAELKAIFADIHMVEQKLLATIAMGCDVRQNYRPFLPESWTKVDHVHFHVLPRTLEDNLYKRAMRFETELFADLPDGERQQMTDLLRG